MAEKNLGVRWSIGWTLEGPIKYFIRSMGLIAGPKDIDQRGLQKEGIFTRSYFCFVYLEKNIFDIFALAKLLTFMDNFGYCSGGQLPRNTFGGSTKFTLFFDSE